MRGDLHLPLIIVITGCTLFAALTHPTLGAPIPGLYNTGVDDFGVPKAIGSTETHFSGISPIGVPAESIIAPHRLWVTDPNAQWISSEKGVTNGYRGIYLYSIEIDLSGFDHTSASISGKYASDNESRILLNGIDKGFSNLGQGTYSVLNPFSIESGFQSGINTLTFVVVNYASTGNPTGLLVTELAGQADRLPIPGDFDGDNDVDGADLAVMFANFNGPGGGLPQNPETDLDGDGDADGVDLATMFGQFTGPLAPANVPEPGSLVLMGLSAALALQRRRV